MDASWLDSGYRLIAELLLHPDDRDHNRVERLLGAASDGPGPLHKALQQFQNDPLSGSADEYVQTVELSPPCPLYLGAYLFDEPTTCRGVGTSGRNAYMLELTGLYRHFGFQLAGRELPDYLPVVAEFLALSLGRTPRQAPALRRRLLEVHIQPAIAPLREKLTSYQSPCAFLLEAFASLVSGDLDQLAGIQPWQPPGAPTTRRGSRQPRRLPVLGDPVATRRPLEVQP
ncbi:MAG: molecular chaperone TorD family protein [Gemmatimonadales bacterium]